MTPDKKTFVSSILTALLIGIPVHAEREVGNGGGAIVCVQKDGSITAQLLDLREDIQNNALNISRSNDPKEVQLERALQKLSVVNSGTATLVQKMREFLATLPSRTYTLDETDPYQLPPPNDTDLSTIKREKNCSLQSVASYDDINDTLTIDSTIFSAMSPTDQAALEFHEALYKVLRTGSSHVTDSSATRKLVAETFATTPLSIVSPYDGIENALYVCNSVKDGTSLHLDHQFYIIPSSNHGYRLLITEIEGEALWDQTYLEISSEQVLSSNIANWPRNQSLDISTFETLSALFPKMNVTISSGSNTQLSIKFDQWNLSSGTSEVNCTPIRH